MLSAVGCVEGLVGVEAILFPREATCCGVKGHILTGLEIHIRELVCENFCTYLHGNHCTDNRMILEFMLWEERVEKCNLLLV
jgi:hypothetical protein